MRSYHKLWINENRDIVTYHQASELDVLIALKTPHTKSQVQSAFNLLAAAYVPRNAFGAAVWKLYSAGAAPGDPPYLTYNGPQLAATVFDFVSYEFHPEN